MEFWNSHPTFYHQMIFPTSSKYLYRQILFQQHQCNCIPLTRISVSIPWNS